MVLLSTSSAVEDTRSPIIDHSKGSFNGFRERTPSHFTMQKQRPANGKLPNLEYANSCKRHSYSQEQTIASVARGGKFQRSWSVDSNCVPDEPSGLPYNGFSDLMFRRIDKPMVQKSISESAIRKRRPGHYKNDYFSNLLIASHDGLTSDGYLANNISNPDHDSVNVEMVQASSSSTDWADRKVSEKFGLSSSSGKNVANRETFVIRHRLSNQHQHLNGAAVSCHTTGYIQTTKRDFPDCSNITVNTPAPIYDQFGVLIGNTTSSKVLNGDDKARISQIMDISGKSDSFHDSSTTNGHSKAVRSSSYPIQVSPTALNHSPNSRRQSVQSFHTPSPRHAQNSGSLSENDKLKTSQKAQMLVKSPAFGGIESEYVTLDERYKLPKDSRMNWTTEATGITTSNGSISRQYRNGCTGSLNETRTLTFNSNRPVKERPVHPSYQLLVSSNGKHTVGNDLRLHSSKSNLLWMNGSGTLSFNKYGSRTANVRIERNGLVPSSQISNTIDRIIEYTEYSNGEFNSKTGFTNNITISDSENRGKLKRCQSLPDLQDTKNGASESNSNFSDDEDGDDFGFLSYPISFSSSCPSAAMNKAKSPSPGTRIFPKRWRSKSKAVPAVSNSVAMWSPGPPGSCAWSSVSGRKVQLRPVSILNLSEPERLILQKIALNKLQSMDIGCPVSIPCENSDQRRRKKSLSLKRRSKSVTSPLDLMMKDGTASGLVFGIPLAKCLLNDRELDKKRSGCSAASVGSPSSMKMRVNSSDNLQVPRSPRKSSSSSQGSVEIGSGKHELFPSHKRAASIDSLPESECSRNTSSSLIDALSLPASNPASRLNSLALDGSQRASQGEAQVPNIVKACFKHIETYGLQTLGIFRVGSSKKRVKQLRDEFDSGRDVQLTEEHNPHDVGALLKEYFRDLPDPLLTRELYLPFIYAERMKDDNKRHLALRLLISMLPVTNRDTLWALLQFLATVSQHATDTTDEKGETVAGNKMDAHNLATLFGPNIIHRTKADKSADKEMLSESAERVEQSKEIIGVVKDMIDNHHELFEISGELRDEILRLLVESNQEVADRILRHIANQNQIETDPESMCSVFEDSVNSPTMYHSMNSDADLLAYAQKQTSASHRPLRITKSADDSLDSPVLKSRVALLSDSQAFSPASKDNHMVMPLNSMPSSQRLNTSDSRSSPMLNRVPVLRVYSDSTIPDSGRSNGSQEYPCSEGYNKCLNIPRPLYFRESSSSSISSDLSSLNGHSWSENGFQGQWALPTPPTSRSASPKALFQSTSSSSTLIASPAPSLLNHPQGQEVSYTYKPAFGSAEWERDRWKHWEKIAAQKKNIDKEQETLV